MAGPGLTRKVGTVLASTALAATLLTTGPAAGAALASQAGRTAAAGGPSSQSWTVYHHDPAGSGRVSMSGVVRTGRPAWTSPVLDGQLFGEPLSLPGRVYVATQNDTVYALSAATGAVAWSTHLGTPVPAGKLPCGDISPTVGIAGTPVIDPSRGEIFVVADELVGGKAEHVLVGLSTTTGQRELSLRVDPPGSTPTALLQRTGLTLDDGRVVFGFGGNFGDCSTYHGWVVSVPEGGGTPARFAVDSGRGQSQGAVWMGGGAPAVDAAGNVFVSVGNGSVHSPGQPYDHSDSVLQLSPSMRLLRFFAPSNWPANNASDLDMSTVPALLPGGQVLIAGKSRIAYLLGPGLGGIGHQRAQLGSLCNSDIDGGVAVTGSTVYLPCLAGILAVRAVASPSRISVLWRSRYGGGPPILAAGEVWTIGQNGVLYGLDPGTGTVRQFVSIGAVANHFPTPSVSGGLMLAAAAQRVVAFTVSGRGSPPAHPPASSGQPPVTRPPASGGGRSPAELAGLGLAIFVLLVLVGLLSRWLRTRRFRY
jgi:outer membrane protein assembly factor BamB